MEPSGVVHTANVTVSQSYALMQVKFDCIVAGYEQAIQETLAHKSIATTARYAHLNKAALMDAMAVLN